MRFIHYPTHASLAAARSSIDPYLCRCDRGGRRTEEPLAAGFKSRPDAHPAWPAKPILRTMIRRDLRRRHGPLEDLIRITITTKQVGQNARPLAFRLARPHSIGLCIIRALVCVCVSGIANLNITPHSDTKDITHHHHDRRHRWRCCFC